METSKEKKKEDQNLESYQITASKETGNTMPSKMVHPAPFMKLQEM